MLAGVLLFSVRLEEEVARGVRAGRFLLAKLDALPSGSESSP